MKIFAKTLLLAALGIFCLLYRQDASRTNSETFVSLAVEAQTANLAFYWKNEAGENFGSIQRLKDYAAKNGKRLRFAMNGGMYQEDGKPLGLFIENGVTATPLNTRRAAEGNFYLPPNGVFYITNERAAFVVETEKFQASDEIKFATQSGPLLVVDGAINRNFNADSTNLNIRNGVCVLENSKIIFAISRRETNFYDFAAYFKSLGCRNALYLDGFVSRMYAPEKNITQTDGDFGVIIGIVE